MDSDIRRILYAVVLVGLTAASTFLFLGWPWTPPAGARAPRSGTSSHYYGGYYSHFGGGHGGWMGRGFGWGTFGEFERDDDGFRGGGPGYGK